MFLPKVAIAQLGARRHYQQPLLLQEWGMLDTFFTDFYAGDNLVSRVCRHPFLKKSLPSVLCRMSDRYEPALELSRVVHFPRFGIDYAKRIRNTNAEETSKVFLESGQQFCQTILERGLGMADTVYGFNTAALELFKHAKGRGIRCILDQTIAERSYVNMLLSEEYSRWPDASIVPFSISTADKALVERERQEQNLADYILCGSSFVKHSLVQSGVDAGKIFVVPVGRIKTDPSVSVTVNENMTRRANDPLRILFAGSVGLRKGVPYLLEALKRIEGEIPFVCKIAGTVELCPEFIEKYSGVSQFLGRVNRSAMAELYAWADVFVLPSICEGSAMVVYEALHYGLPVITTENAGSVVSNTAENRVVQIRNSDAIAAALKYFFETELDSVDCAIQQRTKLARSCETSLSEMKKMLLNLE